MPKGKHKILITGGTGSLGWALSDHWYRQHQLTIFSRNNHNQNRHALCFPGCDYVQSDICQAYDVNRACLGQSILIHAAAVKDVATGEYHPGELQRVNVQGSRTVVEAWTHCQNSTGYTRRAVLISTDKAVHPLNTYGATKKIAESIFRKAGLSVLRYGNVFASAGSFVHFWRTQDVLIVRQAGRMGAVTRFIFSMAEAIELIEDLLDYLGQGNEPGIFVPVKLKSFNLTLLAEASGKPFKCENLLPYEKQHEMLLAEGEAVVPATNLLARVVPGWSDQHLRFCSENARLIDHKQLWQQVEQ